eukprot:2486826-Lingulodinium_polyedra.AAC.1
MDLESEVEPEGLDEDLREEWNKIDSAKRKKLAGSIRAGKRFKPGAKQDEGIGDLLGQADVLKQ